MAGRDLSLDDQTGLQKGLRFEHQTQAQDVWQARQHSAEEQGCANFLVILSLCFCSAFVTYPRNSSLRRGPWNTMFRRARGWCTA